MTTLRTYYLLTKPGIIFGNLITTTCGFLLASRGHFSPLLFLSAFAGLGLVIASSCVFNNYIDRHIDQKMARTRNRPFAKGVISPIQGLIFALFLGSIGLFLLAVRTNFLTTALAALGFFIYVGLYTFWKPHYQFATLVGSISGALPPVIGYTAVTNQLDAGAYILFALLVLWQMPHFFAIAMYRFEDYKAASIPILPLVRGNQVTKIHMLLYILAFAFACFLLLYFHYTGYAYLIVAATLSLSWIYLSLKGFKTSDDKHWARQMFYLSLIIIFALSLAISLDAK